ncbi:MAG: hypothetical protein E6Q62_07625 [Nitrosomonas sp.]|nr:MAG: hypothetical protein E6Q62_07625 [Nitrosomonas sp.]
MIVAILTISAVIQPGCSTQQLYTTGQAWQRNQCHTLIDQPERERCLNNASTAYETYKKQTESENKLK